MQIQRMSYGYVEKNLLFWYCYGYLPICRMSFPVQEVHLIINLVSTGRALQFALIVYVQVAWRVIQINF